MENTEVLIIGTCIRDGGAALVEPDRFARYGPLLKPIRATGALDEFLRVPHPEYPEKTLGFIGLGERVNPRSLRLAAGSGVRQCETDAQITLALSEKDIEAQTLGALLGAYVFDKYKKDKALPKSLKLATTRPPSPGLLEELAIQSEGVALVKDLVNLPGADLYPEIMVQEARRAAESLPIKIKVWEEKELKELGAGGILGVGQGSLYPPRLVKLDYNPSKANRQVGLVGKGITFDSGGLSLKPPAAMYGMKFDMTGAATVLAVVVMAARLGLPVRVVGWMCIAENMISKTATRPGDVLRMLNGKTVEVTNTDAEGRLVMADGLVMAAKDQPDYLVDVATLTGAAAAAFGNYYSALMGNDSELISSLHQASIRAGEGIAAVPIDAPDLRRALRSKTADMVNSAGFGAGRFKVPGMQFAAAFLEQFIGEDSTGKPIPWAHLDIAGSSNLPNALGYDSPGPTASATRSLVEWLRSL